MKTTQLRRQNELAGQLLNKLERIHGIWAKLPTEDQLLAKVEQIRGACAVLPSEDQLRAKVDLADRLAKDMESTARASNALAAAAT